MEPRIIEEFSTSLREVQITINGKPHVVRELDGLQRGKYLNGLGDRVIINDQGKPAGLKDYTGFESALLSQCVIDSSTNQPVPEVEMRRWPSSVLSRLFDIASDLSALNDEAKKKLKDIAKNA